MKFKLLFIFVILVNGCITRPDKATSESSVLDVFEKEIEDQNAPTPGGSGGVAITFMGADSMEIQFELGSDDITKSTDLLYKIAHSASIDALSESSTKLFDWQRFSSGVLSIADLSATPYYFLLMVKDQSGLISYYDQFTNAPELPSDSSISATSIGTNSIDISWNHSSHSFLNPTVLLYQVYISTTDNILTIEDARNNGTLVQDWTLNMSSASIGSLDSSTSYYFKVIVKTSFGVEVGYDVGDSVSTL